MQSIKKVFEEHATQSRQSARLILQSSELGPRPTPSPAEECKPLHPVPGWRDTLACGRGGGRVPIRTRGQTLWYSRYTVYLLCGMQLFSYFAFRTGKYAVVITVQYASV
jgi:hypothetical protein